MSKLRKFRRQFVLSKEMDQLLDHEWETYKKLHPTKANITRTQFAHLLLVYACAEFNGDKRYELTEVELKSNSEN